MVNEKMPNNNQNWIRRKIQRQKKSPTKIGKGLCLVGELNLINYIVNSVQCYFSNT